jgi:hypothetical protein
MRTATSRSIRRLAGGALVLVCLAVAGCGGSSSPGSSTPSATTTAPAASGIPQGPNAGDQDSDNNGGPSDGDGNK